MNPSLVELFSQHQRPSEEAQIFLTSLESSIQDDLWRSAGGHWSQKSISVFRQKSMEKLAQEVSTAKPEDFATAWSEVIRDFHSNFWNEQRLKKKEAKKLNEDDKIFWELFSYIWILLQATFVTKTAIFYFGLKSAEESSTEGKVYVVLAILFSFVSLSFFAYRKTKAKRP